MTEGQEMGFADPQLTTADVLDALKASGKPLREWGRALDGTPMLAARIGGERQPAILVTAGAHCTETAGVHAALALLESLETEHEVHVLPLRDPLGFAGVEHCLSTAAGRPVAVADPGAALEFLRGEAREIWREGEVFLFELGDLGFMWAPPRPGLATFWEEFALLGRLPREEPESLAPLLGKAVLLLNSTSDIDGSGAMQRCYHTVLSEAGEWLHLNRFFGRDDAPPEVAAVDDLVQTVRPGLTCDLHEGNGDGFWMPIPRTDRDAETVFDMTAAFFDYIRRRDYPVCSYENWKSTNGIEAPDPDWMLPEPRLEGLFWLQQDRRAEGYNLMSYASEIGIGYGTEGPMVQPLAMRADGLANGMRAAIEVWERRVESGTSEPR